MNTAKNNNLIAIATGSQNDEIIGTCYSISVEELEQADFYEVTDYTQVKATFESGKQGWIYIKK